MSIVLPDLPAGSVPFASDYLTILTALGQLLNPPRAIASRVTTQAIAHATFTTVTWPIEVEDVGGFFTAGTGTFTVPAGYGGTFQLGGGIIWPNTATGVRACWINHNGAEIEGSGTELDASAVSQKRQQLGTMWASAADGDTFDVTAYQSSGISTNLTSGRFWIKKIS